MKYDHRVKVGGVWFDAGVEVDNSASTSVNTETPENNPPQDNTETPENDDKPTYTRSQIQAMNVATLQELATQLGIEFDEDTTGKELKTRIAENLGI